MKNVFIFHGTYGHPQENWFPWLKEELEKLGREVTVPQFPTPENQTPENWLKVMQPYEGKIGENTILIGHSLGGSFILRLLEKVRSSVHAVFLVATPIGIPPVKFLEGDEPFNGHPFDWKKIRKGSRHFQISHSDNDPNVCIENARELAKNLKTELTIIPEAGHFNESAGYTKFPLLLERIKIIL